MHKPQALWDLVKLINQYGTWGTTKDSPTKGAELWAIWGLEAFVVAGHRRDDSDCHFGKPTVL